MVTKLQKFDFSKYTFIRRINLLETNSKYALKSPIRHKDRTYSRKRYPSIGELGNVIGIQKDDQTKALKTHERRYKAYNFISEFLSLFFYFLMAMGIIIVFAYLLVLFGVFTGNPTSVSNKPVQGLVSILILVVAFLLLQIADRITSIILDKQYADTLSFIAGLNLFVQLAQEGSLHNRETKFVILRRVRGVRSFIKLLSYQHIDKNDETNDWIRAYFAKMERFVEDIERQIVAPTVKTREKLLEVLYPFLNILLNEMYGEFKYQDNTDLINSKPERTLSNGLRFFRVLTPIVLLVILFLFKNQLQILDPYIGLVSLILIIFILIAVDSNLNLGIMDRFSNIAKAIKELK